MLTAQPSSSSRHLSVSSSYRGGSGGDIIGRLACFDLSLLSQGHDSVSSVERGSDLLVGLNESLELDIQVLVLVLQNGAVLIDSVALVLQVVVAVEQVLVIESEVFLFLSGDHELILSGAQLGFPVEHLSIELSVSQVLLLGLALQVGLVSQLAIKISLESLCLSHQPGVIILAPSQLSMRRVQRLIRSPQLKLLGISQLIELIRPLLRLIKIIVNCLDLRIIILALSLLHCHRISQPINLILVPRFLLPQLA